MKNEHNTMNDNVIKRIMLPGTVVGLFLICLYALHDMQTAEGIGLYFTLELGLTDRIYMDALVDVLGIICLMMLLWLPCVVLKRKNRESFCRLFIGYLAMVPTLSISQVMYMFQGKSVFLWENSVGIGVRQWFLDNTKFLQIWLPLLILLYALRSALEAAKNEATQRKEVLCGKWHKGLWLAVVILLAISLLIPPVGHLTGYLTGYLLLILAFDCWEVIFSEHEGLEKWSRIVFMILLLKGIYRIMILVSRF